MKSFIQGLLVVALVVLVGVWAVGQFQLNVPLAAQLQPTAVAPAPTQQQAPAAGPTQQQAPTPQAPTPPAPTPQPATQMTQAQDETALIQQVIERGNQAQAQAITARDPSPMAETATPEHYRQLRNVNDELLDNGVTSISLLNIEWGPVQVNGTTATATSFETWRTTYADGTTEQSRDRNEYVLVRDASGWKVQANSHPREAAAQPAPNALPTPSAPNATIDSRNTSRNWSGYAASGGKFSGVGATWVVPEFSPDRPLGMDAAWVGIGGVRSRDLIQAGTSQTISPSGTTQYQAWVETLPEAAEPVPLAVHPGDTVTVSINEESEDSWRISIVNETTGQTFERTEQYDSSYSSAEWIQEAPSTGRGRLLPLANFGTVSFSDSWAIKDGQRVSIADSRARPITMIGADNQALAVPSELGEDGVSFSVARTEVPASMAGPQRRSRGSQAAD